MARKITQAVAPVTTVSDLTAHVTKADAAGVFKTAAASGISFLSIFSLIVQYGPAMVDVIIAVFKLLTGGGLTLANIQAFIVQEESDPKIAAMVRAVLALIPGINAAEILPDTFPPAAQ